jgi:arylsulfatase A-like enzyme
MRGYTRREFIKALGLGVASCALPGCEGADNILSGRPGLSKPNFVFIFIDDMGWKDLGYMGSRYYETPNIDRLAGQGVVFTSAYANGPNCAPSRACLMSGQYTPRHGIYTVGGASEEACPDKEQDDP